MVGTKKVKELRIGSKNLYMAQNLASGDRVTGKATVQPVRMDCWLKVYLHHLSQHNIESLLLIPGRINFKTCKNSELIKLGLLLSSFWICIKGKQHWGLNRTLFLWLQQKISPCSPALHTHSSDSLQHDLSLENCLPWKFCLFCRCLQGGTMSIPRNTKMQTQRGDAVCLRACKQ